MTLIKAYAKDDAFLNEVHRHMGEPIVRLWWLGQSGFLIGYRNLHILIDPYLSDSLTRKYEHTDKPHIRMSERVADPAKLTFINIVSSSHNHTDHLDADTLKPLIAANPRIRIIIPEANRNFVCERLNIPTSLPLGLNEGKSITLNIKDENVTFHGIPAAHNEVTRDQMGNCLYMGYVIRIGERIIYHSGDTLLFPGLAEILKSFKPDLAILPINGNDPARKVAGNLSIDEAVSLGKDIGAGLVIPCHYDMFTFNTADPALFRKKADEAGLPYRILQGGEGCWL